MIVVNSQVPGILVYQHDVCCKVLLITCHYEEQLHVHSSCFSCCEARRVDGVQMRTLILSESLKYYCERRYICTGWYLVTTTMSKEPCIPLPVRVSGTRYTPMPPVATVTSACTA